MLEANTLHNRVDPLKHIIRQPDANKGFWGHRLSTLSLDVQRVKTKISLTNGWNNRVSQIWKLQRPWAEPPLPDPIEVCPLTAQARTRHVRWRAGAATLSPRLML